jgi:hypothetical protein
MNRASKRAILAAAGVILSGIALTASCGGARVRPKPQAWDASQGPVVPHDRFPADCSLCHAAGTWHEIRQDFSFDHQKETGVTLAGAHAGAQCLRCHNDRGPVSRFANRGCRGCHEDVHQGTMGTDCATCHSESDWNPIGVMAIHGRTRFPLTGAHAAVACNRCHKSADAGLFTGADPRCISCHREDLARAKSPDHLALGFSTDCENCHSGGAWAGARFRHIGIVSGCATCHMKDYAATKNPNHAAAGFGTACESCHTTNAWVGSLNHAFIITSGPHKVSCAQCHTTPGNYKLANCLGCHGQAVTNGHHTEVSGYVYANAACLQCHPTGRGD